MIKNQMFQESFLLHTVKPVLKTIYEQRLPNKNHWPESQPILLRNLPRILDHPLGQCFPKAGARTIFGP
jgi:hypothetical protein